MANATKPTVHKVKHAYATKPFELIFSDVFGPVNPMSHRGYLYAIHFTCAYTKYTKIYFMSSKDQSLDCFIQFIADIENMGHTVQNLTIRTDNDTNYVIMKISK